MPHKEVALKIEHFHHDEDIALHISSREEMLLILQGIARQRTHVALYYGKGRSFILSMLLDVDENGMWLDAGPSYLKNKQLQLSGEITFVGVHEHVKIQFVSHWIESKPYKNKAIFHMLLPDYLLRIQRRKHLRLNIPPSSPLQCLIPHPAAMPGESISMRAVAVIDISSGGIGLLCDRHEFMLPPHGIFRKCQVPFPDKDELTVSLEVRYSSVHADKFNKLIGCRFLFLDSRSIGLLQDVISRLQSKIPMERV